MLTGLLAARNIAGERHEVWGVNVEPEYQEEVRAGDGKSDRSVPGIASAPALEELLSAAFARYDPLAMGIAVGVVLGTGLFLLTASVLVRDGHTGIPLSLLGHYLHGYEVTWSGAVIGLIETLSVGFLFGVVLAALINAFVGWQESVLEAELEAMSLDPLEAG